MSARAPLWFTRFARVIVRASGRPAAFVVAALTVVMWAAVGPIFGFSSAWQNVINTVTTVVTFLMVFLIQHSQNRDTDAIQVKLGELIRALDGAQNSLVDIENLDDHELEELHEKYAKLAERARSRVRSGKTDTGVVEAV